MPKKRKPGRPKLPKNEGRVVLSGRVLPVTKTAFTKRAKQTGKSIGELLDEANETAERVPERQVLRPLRTHEGMDMRIHTLGIQPFSH